MPTPEPIRARIRLDVPRLEGGRQDEREFYLKVARTVVDIFMHGMEAEASVP